LPDIKDTLTALQKRVSVGVVGGSDLKKIQEQLGEKGAINPYNILSICS
jgi:hypothetical protein